MAYDLEIANAHATEVCCRWYIHSWSTVSIGRKRPIAFDGADHGSVCGISIARLVFFVNSGKPYANAYDVTCKTLLPKCSAAANTTIHTYSFL